MTEYILHADDFGISESVNSCIDSCFAKGWLSETSLMVNMPACDAAVALARQKGYAHVVGLHLNLSQGLPLTEPIKKCPRFCNPDGTFNKIFHMSSRGRFFLSCEEQAAVRFEVEAQLQKFCGYEGLLMRIDSHHHVHTDWSVYRILKPLALKYGFISMRITADLHKVRPDKEIYKRFLNHDIRKYFETTDHFDGVGGVLQGPGGTTEVMVHPLMKDGVLCDTAKPYEEQITQLQTVPNSRIRRV